MIYFTADSHINHKNICRGTSQWSRVDRCRDFDTVEDMNDSIIRRINYKVSFDDELYILGDFAFGNRSLISSLKANIVADRVHLIIGNHDYVDKYPQYYRCFDSISYYKEIRYKKLLFCLFHYPIGSWNEIGKGAVNLHGHSHTTYRAIGRQLDVGMDNPESPFSIEEVYQRMIKINPVLTDHHGEETNYG